jgi:signal transduction histidine kinase
MSYLNKIRLAAAIGAVIAVLPPVILKAEDPKETAIEGTIQLPNEGNQEAAQANLATIPVQTAINTAVSSQGGTVLRAELQNDVHLIRRLLLNLLDNALKYNRADGWIGLQVGPKAGLAVIAVANSGPEIPAEHRAHLFEPFYRADNSRSRRTGGTGLDLSICREIVALHQGTFNLRKSTSEETVFEVSLPCRYP